MPCYSPLSNALWLKGLMCAETKLQQAHFRTPDKISSFDLALLAPEVPLSLADAWHAHAPSSESRLRKHLTWSLRSSTTSNDNPPPSATVKMVRYAAEHIEPAKSARGTKYTNAPTLRPVY